MKARFWPFIILLVLAACRRDGEGRGPAELIQIDGSSTVFPIIEAMAEEYQIQEQGAVHITVGISGTGGGFKKFCRGELDITNASRPIEREEMDQCRVNDVDFIELPIAFDAVTVVVHPDNHWLDALTTDELRMIWRPGAQERITRWRDVRNSFPDTAMTLYGAGPDSGTFDYFTATIVGEAHASRGDYTASEDDNVLVRGVATDRNALGYFGLAYYWENRTRLKAVAIINPRGEAVVPSTTTVQQGHYTPLSRPVFIYVNARAAERVVIQRFIQFIFAPENTSEIIKWVGYVPLPAQAYKQVMALFERRALGSRFQRDGLEQSEITLRLQANAVH